MDEPEIEKNVLGRPYHHPLAVVQDDGRTFQLVPRRLPILGYLCYLGIMCLFATGISWVLVKYGQEQNEPWKHAVVWAISVCTGFLVIGFWGWFQVREIKRGPWLSYDRQTQTLLLPRLGETFARNDVVQLQNVTGYSASEVVSKEPEPHSELILVTRRGEKIERWMILGTNVTHRAFGKILDPLAELLEVPVVRLKQRSVHGDFDVQDYVPKSRRR